MEARTFLNYIDGEWQESDNREEMIRENPTNREPATVTPLSTSSDVGKAIDSARKAFDSGAWSDARPEYRAKALMRLARLIEASLAELAALESTENGKILKNSTGEITNAIDHVEYFSALARNLKGDAIPQGTTALSLALKEPVGVCGLIVPWNSPVELTIRKLAPALAAGCTIVLKPSSITPGTILFLAKIIDRAEIPRGVVNVVTGSGKIVGEAIVRSDKVDKISFTGDSTTGKRILALASETMKRVSMELGGKSPFIVFKDANLEKAVPSSLWAIFRNCGQSCTAGSRLLLEESIHDDFIQKLIQLTRNLRIGDPFDPGTDMGPMASSGQLQKTLQYIQIGLEEGAHLVYGGSRLDNAPYSKGYFMQPSILDGVSRNARVSQEEIFGPVLSVISFKDEADAIDAANCTQFGLASSIWTRDLNRTIRISRRLKAGDVWVNGYGLRVAQAPMGGFKGSGIGRELGEKGLEEFLEYKHVGFDFSEDYVRPAK